VGSSAPLNSILLRTPSCRYTLRKYAREGILNLPKDVVDAMKKAGFIWGGDWAVHKDIMHFDMP